MIKKLVLGLAMNLIFHPLLYPFYLLKQIPAILKDNFSSQSALYAQFRPQYPDSLYDCIYKQLSHFDSVWDVGTGNGQVAQALSRRFRTVFATDISARQLEQAPPISNVRYAVAPAENSGAADASFDLVIAGQAAHWFKLDAFYPEVLRVLRPGGLLVLFGYGLLQFRDSDLDAAIGELYHGLLGAYWDAERALVDRHYRDMPFPMDEILCQELDMQYEWTLGQLLGFLASWSAVQHYIRSEQRDPVLQMESQFTKAWGHAPTRVVHFPIFMRMGKI